MNKNYQRLLLNELYRYYPDFSDKWIDHLQEINFLKLPAEEQKRNIAYLLEKKFIEANSSPRGVSLRITASGIEYLERLNAEIETEKVK